jgi:hypothetical protein
MLFPELNIYAQIILVALGLIVLLPWISIPAIALFKFFQVMRLPKASAAGVNLEMEAVNSKLGLTMADGGEKTKTK